MDPVGATVKLNGINHFETTDSGGCSVTDLLCRPCHFLGLSTGTSMCCERGHELRLWTPTHSWETQKMSRENTESKNLLFCKEQRRYMPGSNEEGAQNTFALMWQSDLWTRREAIPLLWIHSFGLFDNWRKSVLLFCLKSEHTGSQECYVSHPKSPSWQEAVTAVESDLSAPPACGSFPSSSSQAVQVFPPREFQILRQRPRLGKISTKFSSSDSINQQLFLKNTFFL